MQQFNQAQWPSWAYAEAGDPFSNFTQVSNYPSYFADSMEAAYQTHQQHLAHHQQVSRTTESKPRLSKEEVEVLEAEFQKNHKPNSTTKKALAESMRVENARINNWFQNRRAREKKENNIRQYEAKQKMEGNRCIMDSGSDDESDHKSDLVASSAPFPGRRQASMPRDDTPATSLDQSTTDQENEDTAFGVHSGTSSPIALSQASGSFETDACDLFTGAIDTLAGSEGLLSADDQSPEYFFGPSVEGLGCDVETNMTAPLAYSLQNATQMQSHANSSMNPAMSCTGAQLRSPPAIDIASRRNRRAPHLAIPGPRSYSSNNFKMGSEAAWRRDPAAAMRRVASATGSGRIVKPTSIPQSPFHERKHEALYHLNRSPGLARPRSAMAPPTPNTPVVSSHQGMVDGYPPAASMDGKFSPAEMAVYDPTLRTPPTTPGFMESLTALNTGYGMSFNGNSWVASDVAGFGGDFDAQNFPVSTAGYMGNSNDSSSQPRTPSYTSQMGSAYFGFPNGSAAFS